jgi:hypothetical protein
MWNMFWRARLTRWQPMEFSIFQALGFALFEGGGIGSLMEKVLGKVPYLDAKGAAVQHVLMETVEICVSNTGRGAVHQIGFGSCPVPMGSFLNGGTITVGDKAPDGEHSVEEVYH